MGADHCEMDLYGDLFAPALNASPQQLAAEHSANMASTVAKSHARSHGGAVAVPAVDVAVAQAPSMFHSFDLQEAGGAAATAAEGKPSCAHACLTACLRS